MYWRYTSLHNLNRKYQPRLGLSWQPVTKLDRNSPSPAFHAITVIMETVRNIQNPIPAAMLQPSKWLPLYEEFVTKNASSVGQVESALRSLTYIIPGAHASPFLTASFSR